MSIFRGQFQIYHGPNRKSEAIQEFNELGYKSVGIILDQNLISNLGYLEWFDEISDEFDVKFVRIPSLKSEPTYEELDSEFEMIRSTPVDLIFAFGGGSIIDLAKGLSILFRNSNQSIQFRGMHKVKQPGVPLVVFPSTAGSGTEMTWTASFIDDNSQTKLGINGLNMFPKFAVLEPKLLVGAPFKVLMSSALDCLVHAIEAVTSKNATSFAKTLGVSAVQKVFEHLPRVKANPNSLEDLEALQIAASEAGLAMLNSSGGPASGISYPLGVHHKVPHGFAGGLLLPLVVAENIANGFDGYSAFLTFKAGTSADFLDELLKLYSDIQAPKNLAEWNFTSEEHLEFIIERTLAERSVNLELNPIPFSGKSVRKVLTACLP